MFQNCVLSWMFYPEKKKGSNVEVSKKKKRLRNKQFLSMIINGRVGAKKM